MLNFSGLSRHRFIGWALRLPLELIPHTAVLRVLQGRLRGLRWIVGASNHGCWLGSYEISMQRRFAAELRDGQVVYDVGANVGFYSLLAARCVGHTGRVFAFEPVPENLAYLRRHLALNSLTQVSVEPVAVSNSAGLTRFTVGKNTCTGHFDADGALEVRTVALDDFVVGAGNPPPQAMKIDVEGAEVRVLQGARRVLETYRPLIFLATHGLAIHQECCAILRAAEYRLASIAGEPVEETSELICLPGQR